MKTTVTSGLNSVFILFCVSENLDKQMFEENICSSAQLVI